MKEKSKKTYDAARTKELILNAAEELFAEQGYSAARIDAIANLAGYNKSLIYQYFKDKLGLYTEVVKRADQLGNKIFEALAGELLSDEATASDPVKFRRLLEEVIRISYQFLLDNPRYLKIFLWESAEEWKTWKLISYSPDDYVLLYELAKAAKRNGIIRKDLDEMMIPILMMNMVIPFVQSYKRLNDMLDDKAKWMSQEQYKDQIVTFVICGIMEPSLL
ncbi:hypothetical protein PAECIP111893_01519 [Paenibacillus plantiphilus]|uniref:HTH tetR-type domain-containing protein n=1 Tax=Paenibacillus plantiphilus TaxID=2905650 RepID=A0ABN8G640_9BACL|nr:TetR/AcrR family transcriptional regulator [Paenibacillus plantiphilus]CAH1200645.1 hypothetical protein PAECIP111893_01519 [Paenibacillus plantiphilus]